MDLGYDCEELGYEEGYEGSPSRKESSKPKLNSKENFQGITFFCQESSSGSVLQRPSAPPDPSIQNRNLKLHSPLVNNDSPVDSVPRARIHQLLPQQVIRPPTADLIHYTGAQDPNATVTSSKGSESISNIPGQLRGSLLSKKLSGNEVDAYMKRFDGIQDPKRKEKMMMSELQELRTNPALTKEVLLGKIQARSESLKRVQAPTATTRKSAVVAIPIGASRKDLSMRDVDKAVASAPPSLRAVAEKAKTDGPTNILHYTLTGKQLDPSHPMELPKDLKVIDPPLTHAEALAYLQAQHGTNSEGKPSSETSADAMMSDAFSIQDGELTKDKIKDQAAAWERQEIVKILNGPSYNLKGQQITRLMKTKDCLGDNIERMESFRNRLKNPKEVEAIKKEANAADVRANDYLEKQVEKDRATRIISNLNSKPKKGDQAVQEGLANRAESETRSNSQEKLQEKLAKRREDFDDKQQKIRLEHEGQEREKDRKFNAEQKELDQKHDSAERAKERKNQMVMSLISFIGQMISAAIQAMTTIGSESIRSSNALGGQIVGGMRGRG